VLTAEQDIFNSRFRENSEDCFNKRFNNTRYMVYTCTRFHRQAIAFSGSSYMYSGLA